MDEKWGGIEIVLEQYLKEHGVSKSRLAREAEIQYTQLTSYCRNEIVRPDLGVLARMCKVLKCDVGDLLKYRQPPEGE